MFGRHLKKLLGYPRVDAMDDDPVRWAPSAGWYAWELARENGYPSPYGHKLIRVMRSNWKTPYIWPPKDLPAQMNVVGLYWQPFEGAVIDNEPTLAIDMKKPGAP